MIKKDFDVFANRYRLILEKGVKNYPEYYSKSTMLEYDRFIYESKKSLKKSNLLEGWRMPSISYIHPLQLVEKSLLSESHYIAIISWTRGSSAESAVIYNGEWEDCSGLDQVIS